jgi:hypothetical protein
MSRTRTRNTIEEVQSSHAVTTWTTQSPYTGRSDVHGLSGDENGITRLRSITYQGKYHGSKVGEKSTITDEPHGFGSYNDVTHTKEVWDCPMVQLKYGGESSEYQGKLCYADTELWASCGPSNIGFGINSYPDYWDSDITAENRAASRMNFGIQDAASNIPQFAGELREFRDLFGACTKHISANVRKMPFSKRARNYLRFANQNFTLKNIVKAPFAADLFNQFALRPLISDLKALVDFSRHMHSQAKRMYSAKPVRVRASVHDRGTWEHSQDHPSTANPYWITGERDRIVTTWAMVKYPPPAEMPDINPLIAALDAAGFDKPVSVAWELTPWSWLIDYFVGVGDFLEQFQGDFIEVPYTILSSGVSVKRVSHNRCTTIYDSGSYVYKYSNREGSSKVHGDLTKSTYTRRNKVLNFEGVVTPQVKLPNFRQVWNLFDIALLRTLGR